MNVLTDLPIDSRLYLLLCFHCLIGAVATFIATRKGRSLGNWFLFGLLGGTIALVAILIMPPQEQPSDH
jgi:hypothetical protein